MALILLFLFLLASSTNSVAATTDITAFIHKTCNQTVLQNQTSNFTLEPLFTALVSQSNTSNFFQTTITDITGLYQCRGDLSHTKCNTCVQNLTKTIQTSCDTARAQLVGCYMWYQSEVYHVDYPRVSGLWYEKCGVQAGTDPEFERHKNRALNILVNSVGSKKGYFAERFTTHDFDDSHMLGQCEGDLGDDDCVDCVKTAVDFAQADCGTSFSAGVYLQKCYISYSDGGDEDGGSVAGLVALMVATVVVVLLQS